MNYYKYVNYWSEFMPFRISKISGLAIYICPMVTNGVDEIAFRENVKNAMANVYTMDGKILFQKYIEYHSDQINVAGFLNGKYLLVIHADGKKYSQIVVKE